MSKRPLFKEPVFVGLLAKREKRKEQREKRKEKREKRKEA